jgi:hypothetical protein
MTRRRPARRYPRRGKVPHMEPPTETQLARAYAEAEAAYLDGKPGTSAAYQRAYAAARSALPPARRGWYPDRIAAYIEAHHLHPA